MKPETNRGVRPNRQTRLYDVYTLYVVAQPLTEFDPALLERFGEVLELLEVGGVVGGVERARLVRVRVQRRVVRVQRVRGARAARARRVRRQERGGAGRRAARRRRPRVCGTVLRLTYLSLLMFVKKLFFS